MKNIQSFEDFLYEGTKEIEGKRIGSMIKGVGPGVKITFDDKIYTSKGSGKWEGPEGEALNWVEVASLTSALGDKKVLWEK
jgi:hypothetical protein